jgi:aminomethyltransferase
VFTNDMLSLEVGQVRYAPFCDAKGKMVGDGTVFKHADDHCWLITALDSDLGHIREVASGLDASIEPATESLPQLGVNGPRARDLLASVCDADVASLRYFRFWPEQVRVGGVPCWVSRTGYSGELGFEVFCSPEHAEDLWAAVTGAGARPYGLAAVETIRIESGLIFIGYDYFQRETSPFDMSLDKLVALGGGDFSGKAALAKEAAAPPNQLVTLVVDGPVPEYGAAVTADGEPVGTLTSPCESPTLGNVIGMAVVRRDLATHGRALAVAVEGGTAPATVGALPIYDPEKTRPRA